MLTFQNIEYLLALIVLIPLTLLFVRVLVWKKKVKKALGDAPLVDALTKNYSDRLYKLKFYILFAALVFGILASANLRKPSASGNDKAAGIDVMVALDVSKSMLSEDVKPSRLDKAKQLINLLIENLDDNRMGFVVFAGRAYLQMPLTTDLEASKIYVSNASPDIVAIQGTEIGDALRLCDRSLDTKEKKHKAVILISDGEDHDPKSEQAVKDLYDHGVIVNTIGVGTPEGAPIKESGTDVYKTDANGQTVISKLNEAELKDIAEKTGGQYYHLDNSITTANEIVKSLDGMEKKTFQAGSAPRQYSSFFPFFIAFAIVLLIVELFVPETKRTRFLQ
ncbi:MAG: VWA domain-containing protein [Ilyomonas sp.]